MRAVSDVQAVAEQLRRSLVAKMPAVKLKGEVEIDEIHVVAGYKEQPEGVATRGGSDGAAGWQARRATAHRGKDKPPIPGLRRDG